MYFCEIGNFLQEFILFVVGIHMAAIVFPSVADEQVRSPVKQIIAAYLVK